MQKITILGLGAMGSRMATSLLNAGFEVTVWNRSADKAQPLVAQGATVAATPRTAVAKAQVVISMVRDDEASAYVWTDATNGALAGMQPGAIAIESSTLTPHWVKSLNAQASQHGIAFVDAPVAGSRPQAEAGQLIYLVGGNEDHVTQVEPVLKAMGAAVHHAGPVGSGAVVKLMVNALFGIQVAAVAELLAIARQSGLDTQRALDIMAATPVTSTAAKLAGQAMLSQNFKPMFPVELVAKDFGYVTAAAHALGNPAPVSTSVERVLQTAIASGLADQNLTAIAQLY